jgi:hypothetical protein
MKRKLLLNDFNDQYFDIYIKLRNFKDYFISNESKDLLFFNFENNTNEK